MTTKPFLFSLFFTLFFLFFLSESSHAKGDNQMLLEAAYNGEADLVMGLLYEGKADVN